MDSQRIVRLFIAHPDCTKEGWAIISRLCEQWQKMVDAAKLGYRVDPFEWRESVSAGFNLHGAQARIEQVADISRRDIVIGLVGSDMGRIVTGEVYTYTEHEIRQALELWRSNGKPEVKVYFLHPLPEPHTEEETKQHQRIADFKQELQAQGITKDYSSWSDLERILSWELSDAIWEALGAIRFDSTRVVPVSDTPIRSSGLSEYVADIEIEISAMRLCSTGFLPGASLDLLFSTNVTSRIDNERRYPETVCRLIETPTRGESARFVVGEKLGENAIRFSHLPLVPDPRSCVRITVSGVRVDAASVGCSATRGESGIVCYSLLVIGGDDGKEAARQARVWLGNVTPVSFSVQATESGLWEKLPTILVSRRSAVRPNAKTLAEQNIVRLPIALTIRHPGHLSTVADERPSWLFSWGDAARAAGAVHDESKLNAPRILLQCSGLPESSRAYVWPHLGPRTNGFGNKGVPIVAVLMEDSKPNGGGGELVDSRFCEELVGAEGGRSSSYIEVPVSGGCFQVAWKVVSRPPLDQGAVVIECPIVMTMSPGAQFREVLNLSVGLGPTSTNCTSQIDALSPRFTHDPASSRFDPKEALSAVAVRQVAHIFR